MSKSRYVPGLQCRKMLWWLVHEPDAPEPASNERLQAAFARGNRIGELARAHVPGGVLVEVVHQGPESLVAATATALAEGARAVYEASFFEDGIFVSVDILERRCDGFVLVEVKSTSRAPRQHAVPDPREPRREAGRRWPRDAA